ncbi:MAG: hypothetical protein EBS07_04435 [Sphingobacteriia bacterium]|nr:hypothetical protein [Sphingobacteriia bacterium]
MKTVFAYLFSISCLLLFTQACKSSKSPIKVEIIENASPTSKATSTEMNSTDPVTPAAAKAPAERLHRMVHESKMILFELGMSEGFFTAHISLKEMVDEENDKKVVWQLNIQEYTIEFTDQVSASVSPEGRVVYHHSLKEDLSQIKDPGTLISRIEAEKVLTNCLGNYETPTLLFIAREVPGVAHLFLSARTPKVSNDSNNTWQIGYVNLETGDCEKETAGAIHEPLKDH